MKGQKRKKMQESSSKKSRRRYESSSEETKHEDIEDRHEDEPREHQKKLDRAAAILQAYAEVPAELTPSILVDMAKGRSSEIAARLLHGTSYRTLFKSSVTLALASAVAQFTPRTGNQIDHNQQILLQFKNALNQLGIAFKQPISIVTFRKKAVAPNTIWTRTDVIRVLARFDPEQGTPLQRYTAIHASATFAERSWMNDTKAFIERLRTANRLERNSEEQEQRHWRSIWERKHGSNKKYALEEVQLKDFLEQCPNRFVRLPCGSCLLFDGDRGLLEAKTSSVRPNGKQFEATFSKIRKHKIGAALLDVYVFDGNGDQKLLIRVLVKLQKLNAQLDARDHGKVKIREHFTLAFTKPGLAFAKHTEQILTDSNAIVWKRGEPQKDWLKEVELIFPLDEPRVIESDWRTRSENTRTGDQHEAIVEAVLLSMSRGLVLPEIGTNQFADRIFRTSEGRMVTVQVKTIINNNKTNTTLLFPTCSLVDGINSPYTLEHCCDLILAVRAGDFSKSWKSPGGARFALLVFSKEEICIRGTKNFCFRAGEHLEKAIFVDQDGVEIGRSRPAVLSALGFLDC